MTFSERLLKLQGWCTAHYVPFIHGCVWDRECRAEGAPPRISLLISYPTGRTVVLVDLPGYWRCADRRWHSLRVRTDHVKKPTVEEMKSMKEPTGQQPPIVPSADEEPVVPSADEGPAAGSAD
ncbi:MAG: hypothetical protein ACRDTZ_00905 [Pseudonocardiaceae bacterium]